MRACVHGIRLEMATTTAVFFWCAKDGKLNGYAAVPMAPFGNTLLSDGPACLEPELACMVNQFGICRSVLSHGLAS